MILKLDDWRKLRAEFTKDEIAGIRKNITGGVASPRGWSLNSDALESPIRTKLMDAIISLRMPKP